MASHLGGFMRGSRLSALGFGACIALVACVQLTSAQYLKHPDPRIPRTPDGKPNLAAAAPRLPDGKPDLTGIWNAADGRFLTNISRRAGFDAPFTPAGAALFKERQETEGRDRPAGRCLPHTVPTAMMVPNYPWKVVQTPNLMVVLFENFTQWRQIFTDGRDFPVERAPTWFGYSLGQWDGDTFVVNVLGFNDKGWLDDGGHPRSESMQRDRAVASPHVRQHGHRVHVRRSGHVYEAMDGDHPVRTPARHRHHRERLREREGRRAHLFRRA